ncbi:MAG: hypothetical protein P8R42_06615 [Candidatus Binatia bacterium]|nr:hypothetical protein [Candidatus Binatia bacterium]
MDGTTPEWVPLETARRDLLPRLETLQRMAESSDEHERAGFFRGIAHLIRRARETHELMEPFMLLSTSAFQGFTLTAPEAMVLDEALEMASHMSEVLARDDGPVH